MLAKVTKSGAKILPDGTTVLHDNRGTCIFRGLDKADPSGETAWVYVPQDDEEVMVSVARLYIEAPL